MQLRCMQSRPVVDRLDRSLAVFFQDEWEFSKRWTLYLGGRLDDSGIISLR